jgi:hypothetical protein
VTIGLEFEDGIAGGGEAAPFLYGCWSIAHCVSVGLRDEKPLAIINKKGGQVKWG